MCGRIGGGRKTHMNRETTVRIHETLSFFVYCFMQPIILSSFIVINNSDENMRIVINNVLA